MIPQKVNKRETEMIQERLSVSKGEISSSQICQDAIKKTCANISRRWRHCGLMWKSTSCTASSVCRRKTCYRPIRKRASSCASSGSKGWTGRCSPQSSTRRTGTGTLKSTSWRQLSLLRANCRRIHSIMTRAKPSRGNSNGSSISSPTSRVENQWRVPRLKVSGSSTSGRNNSAHRSDSKLSSTQCWIKRSRSRNSRRD